ncbi:hypothetical protein COU60_02825 [Candidatus Pacearchaeota archaeon CG10_big_fil_rev_8_21_14_0_10_34_76]|nr:MAG: hypothetical protein COU60_02825 [Candidatus Pacearchaeota archaeon CG10_big_fil_rev_8_21_14_0_10_34_76]
MNFDKGQHFLTNHEILKKEIKLVELSKKDNVIEIGSGTGNLTKLLAESGVNVISFEIDNGFREVLNELEKEYSNLKIRIKDALKDDWRSANKIVANIPYHLSEAIVMKTIKDGIEKAVFIVGEKFKCKILGETKIGLMARYFYDIKEIMKVSREEFSPSPRIDSWLIVMDKKSNVNDKEKIMQNFVLYKGKIKNGLVSSFVRKGMTKNDSKKLITDWNLNGEILNKNVGKLTYELLRKIEKLI